MVWQEQAGHEADQAGSLQGELLAPLRGAMPPKAKSKARARAKAGGLRRPAGAGDVMRRPAGTGGVGADPVRRPVDARRRDVDGEYEEKEFSTRW